MKKIILIQIILVLGTVMAFLGALFFRPVLKENIAIERLPLEVLSVNTTAKSESVFINKAVLDNLGKHYLINFRPLRENFINIQKKYPHKTYIYFLYINNGTWVGMNEKEEFTAASTLKVPLAMSLLKSIEERKLNLADRYGLEELNLDSNFGDLYKIGAEKELTVEELLHIMLVESDNTAMNAIIEIFKRIGVDDPLADVYAALGWEFSQTIPELGQAPNYSNINLKTLSNMFLALYDAKYINVENSNRILEYLANTPFEDRISAGVPSSVLVSHKIGTAGFDNTYSDCGIVYAPNRTYLLCIGSNGVEEKKAAEFMAEISKAAYDYVINN